MGLLEPSVRNKKSPPPSWGAGLPRLRPPGGAGTAAHASSRAADGHEWWRIANPDWANPLDPEYAKRSGGRWNPPESFPTLYLNEDRVTARLNLRLFITGWSYEPEDLRNDTGPLLIGANLPRNQRVADVHSREGIASVNLPPTYPVDANGKLVPHAPCQAIGREAKERGLRGVRCRSARAPGGAGRELAWFPATTRSRVRRKSTLAFEQWFWG